MKEILHQNKLFLSLFILFVIVLYTLIMTNNHGDSVLFFAKHRTIFANELFIFMSKVGEGAGYIFCFVLLLVIGFKYIDGLTVLLTGVFVTVFSLLGKGIFARTRPLPYFNSLHLGDQLHLIQGVHVNVAATSFPSGHTTSGFALFSLLAFFLWRKPFLAIICFIIAVLIAISRVYLVQHFLVDIMGGSILGVSIALLVKFIHNKIKITEKHWLNKRLVNKK